MSKVKTLISILSIALVLSGIGTSAAIASVQSMSFAVIGDIPYGSTQLDDFEGKISQINADPNVQLVTHVGDISEPVNCTTTYYKMIKARFNLFADPLVYTPGDNEWTDCSRASIGAANPIERLGVLRKVFYPTHGKTLGQHPISVTAQSATGFPENVRFVKSGISFAALHIPGSNNDLKPWKGYTASTKTQQTEVNIRTKATITMINNTFASAVSKNSRAVVLFTQADMFDSSRNGPTYQVAFTKIAKALAKASAAYPKPVFLFNGDSHHFVQDQPFTKPLWLSYYGITTPVPNLTRVTIEGGETVAEWLKVTIVPDTSVLKIERVPFN